MVGLEMHPERYWAPAILPSAGAIPGLNLTRRYRTARGPGAQPGISMQKRSLKVAPRHDSYYRITTHYVNLINMNF
ncbi:MAG: hypothetical protein GF417_10995 [Candidatus Latescibacteria bacterium]|nr:hypothetical protein [bacterium]MBD3424952.1 hypothetical protein [Candidatus Latescibacterota bacterium]